MCVGRGKQVVICLGQNRFVWFLSQFAEYLLLLLRERVAIAETKVHSLAFVFFTRVRIRVLTILMAVDDETDNVYNNMTIQWITVIMFSLVKYQ